MSGRRALLGSTLLVVTILGAGCGSAAHPASVPPRPARPLSLATSLATSTGTWAVAVMGGSAASHNNFWQLFARPAGSASWRLATPPGVASNGGLVLASPAAGSVVAAFRPSQYLSSSPLATTHDNGTTWTPAILDASLADVPDAMAAGPGGRLLALLTDGTAELSGPHGTPWAKLANSQPLAASAAARACRPSRRLTAAAFSRVGAPLLAADCTHPGRVGIFSYTGGTWRPAGPTLPAAYARQTITVLRLTTTSGTTSALLTVGTGPTARLLAAATTGGTARWTVSQPLPLHGAAVTSASQGAGGAAVVLNTGHADTLTGTMHAWQPLPSVPPGTATLAPGPAGSWEALAVHRTRLTIWRLRADTWTAAQTLSVPIEFGSSG